MLITCPECKNQVSDQAKTCPHCAFPLKNKGVQTVEQTSKNLKAQTVIAALLLVFGLFLLFVAGAFENPISARATSILMMFVGVIWLIVVKILTWWRHA